MSAFHSRAGRNAATCAVSAVAKGFVKNGTGKNANGAQSTAGIPAALLSEIRDTRLRKLLELIESDPLGRIQDWAVALNLSQSHLQHLFKQATGLGLGHLLAEKRLQRAAHLLATTNLSIKEIAVAVGYEHASSFTRAFERRFERAPRSYRMDNANAAAFAERQAS